MPAILTNNENGAILRYEKIPHSMFNFYALRKRTYKNGKSLWALCVEVSKAPAGRKSPACVDKDNNYIRLESFTGTKDEAMKRIDEIIKEYK